MSLHTTGVISCMQQVYSPQLSVSVLLQLPFKSYLILVIYRIIYSRSSPCITCLRKKSDLKKKSDSLNPIFGFLQKIMIFLQYTMTIWYGWHGHRLRACKFQPYKPHVLFHITAIRVFVCCRCSCAYSETGNSADSQVCFLVFLFRFFLLFRILVLLVEFSLF